MISSGFNRLRDESRFLVDIPLPRQILKTDGRRIKNDTTNKNQKITIKKTKIMMTIKNRVQLIGNLGASPEVKELENGNKVARFSLATSEFYTNKKGEKVTETHWHNVVVWGKLADIAKNLLEKGSQVAIDGKLSARQYTDKQGAKKYISEIVATEFLVINKKEK
jgi:single-strand DNA-binding protein